MMRKQFAAFMAALVLSLNMFAPAASAQGRRGEEPPPPYPYWETRRDPPQGHEFRAWDDQHRHWDDRRHPPPYWNRDAWARRQSWLRRHGHDDDDHDSSAGLVLGVILGFALGAAVVDSQEQQTYATSRLNDPGWIAYCARRYRSFDPYTGTYLGYDGLRHYCR